MDICAAKFLVHVVPNVAVISFRQTTRLHVEHGLSAAEEEVRGHQCSNEAGGRTQQEHVPGMEHDSGRPYNWTGRDLVNGPQHDIGNQFGLHITGVGRRRPCDNCMVSVPGPSYAAHSLVSL